MKVLSTKKLDETLIAASLQHHIEIACVEMIRVTEVRPDTTGMDIATYDAVALTSSHAVTSAMKDERLAAACATRPVYALSGKTKETLEQHGIRPYAETANAEALALLILKNKEVHSLLHPTGNLRLDTLQKAMQNAGVGYSAVEVYHTAYIAPEIKEAFDAILFFSPSGIDSYLRHNAIKPGTLCCCIGQTTADHLRQRARGAQTIVPSTPTPTAMLQSLRDHLAYHKQ